MFFLLIVTPGQAAHSGTLVGLALLEQRAPKAEGPGEYAGAFVITGAKEDLNRQEPAGE